MSKKHLPAAVAVSIGVRRARGDKLDPERLEVVVAGKLDSKIARESVRAGARARG